MIQTLATLFIIYEVTKLLLPERYIKTFKEMGDIKIEDNTEAIAEKVKSLLLSKYTALFIVEIFYLIFVAGLLFTSYWIVGALLISLAIVFKKRLTPQILFADSIASILVLMLVFIL